MNFRTIRVSLLIVLCVTASSFAADQAAATRPSASPIHWTRPIEQKCFFLLSTLSDNAQLSRAIHDDPALSKVTADRREAMSVLNSRTAEAVIDTARWTDAEIAGVGESLVECLAKKPELHQAVVTQLRSSGLLIREASLSDDELIKFAWTSEAKALNHILDVYGNGAAPAYPKIDSMSFDHASADWSSKVDLLASQAYQPGAWDCFFDSSLKFALGLLNVNGRDEAGRFEPMSDSENAAAITKAKSVKWSDFSYSSILVPGQGPEKPDVALDPGGRARVELAAREFKAGKAPFIIVSGGYVHPNKTRFCEAIEMRRELIDNLGIPADAVIIEPHARHTTTNLRNGARLIYRYGLPMDKPVLVTTNAGQAGMIGAAAFARRNLRELGYEPATIGKLVSVNEIEVTPNIESLEADPMSPLDP